MAAMSKKRPDLPPAPKHLSREAAEWWTALVVEYELELHHLKLLRAACECWDRLQGARAIVSKEGITVEDRHGVPRKHPACGVEEQARVAFARLVRELDLDGAPGPDPRVPRRGRR